jgi:hypothetical protein
MAMVVRIGVGQFFLPEDYYEKSLHVIFCAEASTRSLSASTCMDDGQRGAPLSLVRAV